jgi:beta-fructofuranosidase
MEQAVPQADTDSRQPLYHFRPPARWIGDCNGPLYHQGYYHLFYQHDPNGDVPSEIVWGHARSRDLIHWEHLPIALHPSVEDGETDCWSGDSVIRSDGTPMIFYTSVPAEGAMGPWAAVGDDDLIRWRRAADPVLPAELHHRDGEIGLWRDPFVFRHEGDTYLITGGYAGQVRGPGTSKGVVPLYRATDKTLSRWEYLGRLFEHPISYDAAQPNFFPVGDKWVLVLSRHNPHVVDYLVGSWNTETFSFEPETAAPFEYGEGVYGTMGFVDPQGRIVLWGAIHNWREEGLLDWPGCLTLPRTVTLRSDGLLTIEPLAELRSLRGQEYSLPPAQLVSSAQELSSVRGDLLEIIAELEPGDAKAFGLRVRRSDDGRRAVTIRYGEEGLEVAGERGLFNENEREMGPFVLKKDEDTLRLHLFLDKGVIEVYANRRACFSRPMLDTEPGDLGIELFAEGGSVAVKSFTAWQMKPVW